MEPVKPFAPRKGTALPAACDLLLSIDPGLHTGWALFDTTLLACGTGDPPTGYAKRLVIEVPEIYPRQPVPPNDLIALAFMAGRYVGRHENAHFVLPKRWKGNMPKEVCAARIEAALTSEEKRILAACGASKGQMHNVIDAIGIGLYALGRFR